MDSQSKTFDAEWSHKIDCSWIVHLTEIKGKLKKKKRLPINTPTKIQNHCTEQKNDNNAVACNRVLWELNNLFVDYKWTNKCVRIWYKSHKWKMSFFLVWFIILFFSLFLLLFLYSLSPTCTTGFQFNQFCSSVLNTLLRIETKKMNKEIT